jgi:hemoglobin
MTNPAGKSLYARLGGYDALAAAVDDLIPRLQDDPQIGFYWRQ